MINKLKNVKLVIVVGVLILVIVWFSLSDMYRKSEVTANTTTNEQLSTTSDETGLTESGVDYYPYIYHVRTVFNNYLNGSNKGAEEAIALESESVGGSNNTCGLTKLDKSYLGGKFFIYDINRGEYGGVVMNIVFVEHPDKLFWVWVYRLDGNGEYSLRGFCEQSIEPEKQAEFTEMTHEYMNSEEFSSVF